MSVPATFYAVQGGNDLYWRMEAPARSIGANICTIPEEGGFYPVMFPNQDTMFRWDMHFWLSDGSLKTISSLEEWREFNSVPQEIHKSWANYHDHEGAAVWIRPDLVRANHARAMRAQGVRVIAETDDNYFCDPKFNLFLRANKWGETERLEHARAVASMDAIVLSTDSLRDTYHRELKKRFGKKYLPPLHVCRNNVPETDWPERIERTGPLRVGWMGSPSHIWDVDFIWSSLMRAQELGCETHLIGFNPVEDVHEDPDKPGFVVSQQKLAAWKRLRFKHTPWQLPEQYHRLALPLDIGLCPLLTNEFTLGKSDIKAIEYGISGAAVVAQNNPVYNKTLIHGETALLAGSPGEFTHFTEMLIKDENLRERLVTNLRQYIREERGEKQLHDEWSAALAA